MTQHDIRTETHEEFLDRLRKLRNIELAEGQILSHEQTHANKHALPCSYCGLIREYIARQQPTAEKQAEPRMLQPA